MTDENEDITLQDALAEEATILEDELAEETETEPEAEPDAEVAEPETETEPETELTKPLENWPKEVQEAFSGIQDNNVREAWMNQYKEFQSGFDQKAQEFAGYRRQADPIMEVLQPHMQQMQQQGIHPAQAIQQLLAYQQGLQSDPINTIAQIAQSAGISLEDVVLGATQPDPNQQIQQQMHNMQAQMQAQFDQQQRAQQVGSLTQELETFAALQDSDGNLLHPHFDKVQQDFVGFINSGMARDFQTAYDKAVAVNPDIQAELTQSTAKKSAVSKISAANKAKKAGSRVKAKSSDGEIEDGDMNLHDLLMDEAEKQAG